MSDAALQPALDRVVELGSGPRRLAAWRNILVRRGPSLGWILVLPAVVLPVWVIGTDRGWLAEQILPRPAEVWHTLLDMLRTGELAQHAAISLWRVADGFAVGAGAGLAVGAAMGLSRRVDEYLRPLFTAIAQVPALAWIPLAMLLLGIGEALKIVVIAKAACVPVVMNTSAGIGHVPRAYVEVGEAFRFTVWQKLRHIVLPAAVPQVFTGLRYGLTHAWIALVSVELLASSEGLGYLLVWGRQMFWLDTVLVAMIAIGLIGFLTDGLLAAAERRLQRWRGDGG